MNESNHRSKCMAAGLILFSIFLILIGAAEYQGKKERDEESDNQYRITRQKEINQSLCQSFGGGYCRTEQ